MDLVQLARKHTKEQELYVVATNEEVEPIRTYPPFVIRLDQDASYEERVEKVLRNGRDFNAFEVSDGLDFGGGTNLKFHAVVHYVIGSDYVERALAVDNRRELEDIWWF